jgi:hypothetical protein
MREVPEARELMSVGEAAAELGTLPRHISDAFYAGKLGKAHGFVAGDRRLVYRSRLEDVRRVLQELGRIPEEAAAR